LRIRDCFTIPEGQKATEKAFGRVLLASVCSVFLCMACLVGTTLAWFTVSVENPGNVIEIAVPEVSVSEETDSTESALKRLTFTHNNDPDDFGSHGNIYVTVHFVDVNLNPVSFLLDADTYSYSIEIGDTISYTYEVSWSAPSNTDRYDGNPIRLPEEETDPSPSPSVDPNPETSPEVTPTPVPTPTPTPDATPTPTPPPAAENNS